MTDQIKPLMPLGAIEQGCLLFADITGYTKFIDQTEITHAQDVISDLLETMLSVLTPTFDLSRVEGDAIFAFAPSSRLTPALVLDTVDTTYFAFRKRLRDVVHATSCPCQACLRIPQLDLKFFLHDGEYAVKKVAGFTELSGMDVIVLHRLAKGTAKSIVDGRAYAVYTKAILDQMGLDPVELGLIHNVEEFADTGPVDTFVQDMESRWQAEESARTMLVGEDEAILARVLETPAPRQVVWDHLTNPLKRLLWQEHVTEVIPTTGGRPQTGSVNHCMHGPDATIEHIADWRPFNHLTLRYDTAGVEGWLWTYRLESRDDGGTRLSLLISDPGADQWNEISAGITGVVDATVVKLKEVVDAAAV